MLAYPEKTVLSFLDKRIFLDTNSWINECKCREEARITPEADDRKGRLRSFSFEVKAFLFDLDDTLYNRDKAYSNWARLFARTCFPDLDMETLQEVTAALVLWDDHGYAARDFIFTQFLQHYPSTELNQAEFLSAYYEGLIKAIEPEQATVQLLHVLTTSHIPFGVITNGSARQQQKIKLLGLDQLTSCIYISHVFGVEKPDPAIFLAAAAHLQVQPQEVLFVGDHPHNDIWGAHQVGMHTAWLQRAYLWPETLPMHMRDLTLDSLSELFLLE